MGITSFFVGRYVSTSKGVFSRLCSGLAVLLFASHAQAIECSKTLGNAERMVCSSTVLLELDTALNNNYKGMVYSDIGDGARAHLKLTQRAWLKKRDACATHDCLLRLYAARVDEVCEMPVISGIHAICETADTVLKRNAVSLPANDGRSGVAK